MDLRRQKRCAVKLQSIMIGASRKEWAGVVIKEGLINSKFQTAISQIPCVFCDA